MADADGTGGRNARLEIGRYERDGMKLLHANCIMQSVQADE